VLAGQELPQEENYDGYPQLENGVGMLRLLLEETRTALKAVQGDDRREQLTVVTGKLAFPYMKQCLEQIKAKFPNIQAELIAIENRFFGEEITVSGLITGQDLMEQLSGRNLGSRVLIPINMLRSGEEVFLDDVTVNQVQKALQVPVVSVKSSGYDLVGAITGVDNPCQESERFRPYEPTE
jgi:NifB/MoaA-like Fe-S oxidoreductase